MDPIHGLTATALDHMTIDVSTASVLTSLPAVIVTRGRHRTNVLLEAWGGF
jgi:hypothetical protein